MTTHKSLVHYAAMCGDGYRRAACGRWLGEEKTTYVYNVTCADCRDWMQENSEVVVGEIWGG